LYSQATEGVAEGPSVLNKTILLVPMFVASVQTGKEYEIKMTDSNWNTTNSLFINTIKNGWYVVKAMQIYFPKCAFVGVT